MAFFSALSVGVPSDTAGRPAYDFVTQQVLEGKGLSEEAKLILENTTTLDLSEERLTYLHSSIRLFKNLTTLLLTNNNLTCLPFGLQDLKQLTTLHVRGNKFPSLPLEIGRLPNLEKLWIDRPFYAKDLPKTDGSLPTDVVKADLKLCSEEKEALFEKFRILRLNQGTNFNILPRDVRNIICENLIHVTEKRNSKFSLDFIPKISDATCVAAGEFFHVLGHKTGLVTVQPANVVWGRHGGRVNAVKVFKPESSESDLLSDILSCSDDGLVIWWHVHQEDGKKPSVIQQATYPHDGPVLDIATFGKKKFLSRTKTHFYVWDSEKTKIIHAVEFPKNTTISNFFSNFSPDKSEFWSGCVCIEKKKDEDDDWGSWDSPSDPVFLHAWSSEILDSESTEIPLTPLKVKMDAHLEPSTVTVSPDFTLAFVDHALWEIQERHHISELTWSPEKFGTPKCNRVSVAHFIVGIGYDRGIRLWNLETKQPTINLTPVLGVNLPCVAIDMNTTEVFAVFGDGSYCNWTIDEIPLDEKDPAWEVTPEDITLDEWEELTQ